MAQPPAAARRVPPVPPVPSPGPARPLARLPVALTGFVGRQHEIDLAGALLRRADVRFVTLTGPGGVGKTRLALRVAEDLAGSFADGVAFVPLAPIADPGLMLPALARALGVRDAPAQPLGDRLAAALADRHLLLVLDNFEQVVAAAPAGRRCASAASRSCPSPPSRCRVRAAT